MGNQSEKSKEQSRVVPIAHDFQFETWENKVNKYKALPVNCYYLPLRFTKNLSLSCMQNSKVELFYPETSESLQTMISSKRVSKQLFAEADIWFFLYNLSQAVYHFQENNEKIGNIHPSNILFSTANSILVVNKYSWPTQALGPQRIIEGGRGCYLAPEQLQNLRNKVLFGGESVLSDSYSIGMTILQAGTLQNVCQCYDYALCSLDTRLLDTYKLKFKQNYENVLLLQIMNNLLMQDLEKRVSPREVWAMLEPYREQIIGRQAFKASKQVSRESMLNIMLSQARREG